MSKTKTWFEIEYRPGKIWHRQMTRTAFSSEDAARCTIARLPRVNALGHKLKYRVIRITQTTEVL